jgi:hypothetical protein
LRLKLPQNRGNFHTLSLNTPIPLQRIPDSFVPRRAWTRAPRRMRKNPPVAKQTQTNQQSINTLLMNK